MSSAGHHRLGGDAVVSSFVDEPLRAVTERHSEKTQPVCRKNSVFTVHNELQ